MKRYETFGGSVEGLYVFDHVMNRAVPGTSCSTQEQADLISTILNQRVEHPELTRADGKLVSV